MTNRREFLQSTALLAFAGIMAGTASAAERAGSARSPLLFADGDGDIYLFGPRRARVAIKVAKTQNTAGNVAVLTEDIAVGGRIPIHLHRNEDEFIFIVRGAGTLTLGDEEKPVTAGAFAFVPRNVWHGLQNSGTEDLRMLYGYSPGGFENYFRDLGVRPNEAPREFTESDWIATNDKYGIEYRR